MKLDGETPLKTRKENHFQHHARYCWRTIRIPEILIKILCIWLLTAKRAAKNNLDSCHKCAVLLKSSSVLPCFIYFSFLLIPLFLAVNCDRWRDIRSVIQSTFVCLWWSAKLLVLSRCGWIHEVGWSLQIMTSLTLPVNKLLFNASAIRQIFVAFNCVHDGGWGESDTVERRQIHYRCQIMETRQSRFCHAADSQGSNFIRLTDTIKGRGLISVQQACWKYIWQSNLYF